MILEQKEYILKTLNEIIYEVNILSCWLDLTDVYVNSISEEALNKLVPVINLIKKQNNDVYNRIDKLWSEII